MLLASLCNAANRTSGRVILFQHIVSGGIHVVSESLLRPDLVVQYVRLLMKFGNEYFLDRIQVAPFPKERFCYAFRFIKIGSND